MELIRVIGAAAGLTVGLAAMVAKPRLLPRVIKIIQAKGDAHHAQNGIEN